MADPVSTDPLERFEAAVRVRVGTDADEWLAAVPDLISSVTGRWDLHVTGRREPDRRVRDDDPGATRRAIA